MHTLGVSSAATNPAPKRCGGSPLGWALLAIVALLTLPYLCVDGLGSEDAGIGPGAAALFDAGANEPFHVINDGQIWRVITAVFLHVEPIHLGSNLLWLGLLMLLIHRLRLARPWEAVIVALAAAAAGHVASALASDAMSVGASGGVFGLLGLAVWRGGVAPRHSIPPWQRWSLLLVGVLSLLVPLGPGATPQIDHAAHLGGLLTGFLTGFAAWPTHRWASYAALGVILSASAAQLIATRSATPFPLQFESTSSAEGLPLPNFGRHGWLDSAGRCTAQPGPVRCRLLPLEAAALTGSVRDVRRGHPELAAHLPDASGCTITRTHSGRGEEKILAIRRDDQVLVVVAREAAWTRLGAVRSALRSGRCPGTESPAP